MNEPMVSLLIGIAVLGTVGVFFWPERGLVARWRDLRRLTDRVLQEDALKHIQKLGFAGRSATLQSVAGSLDIDLNRTVAVLARLEELGLIERTADMLHLTSEGEQVALNVIRAHRLWEMYLAEQTGFEQSEWHTQAHQREHSLTAAEMDELAGRLGNPLFDPHGDPIPTSEGQLWDRNSLTLTELQPNQTARIVHVGDEPEAVAAQIQAEGLLPGMLVRVLDSTSQRVRFITDGEDHVLAPIVAASINVILLEEEAEPVTLTGFPLSDLKVGNKGRILTISPRIRGADRRRLMDLGMLPGTMIEAELRSPVGDPVAYRVRDSLIALRKEQARCIQVESVFNEE